MVSSTSAINTLRNAEEQLNNTIEYVDEAKQSIDEAITAATDEVKQKALDAANEAINDAAATATGIVVEYANNEIKPLLNEIASNAAESAENASESAGLAASESANAAISATDSQHYAEDSRIWAEGSDGEVKNVDGEHSSKVWSEMAKTSATSAASSAELAKSYGNDKINQTHITNCITEIPQDIKLELVDGKLTLKAGSKVYVPNGAGKFDEVVVSADIKLVETWGTPNDTMMLFYVDGKLSRLSLLRITSGATDPYTGTTSYIWYDTTNNWIKWVNTDGTSNAPKYSLPLCIFTAIGDNTTSVASIDQVFNGFGHIGSTVFALPGVKGLIPNGRNADGTLKNVEFTTSKVLTFTRTNTSGYSAYLTLNSNAINIPSTELYNYDQQNNINTFNGAKANDVLVGSVVINSGKVTSFAPKLPFRAVDYNDLPTITYWER